MSGVPPRPRLFLAEEFVLLSHLPSGKVHGSTRAAVGCAAAELGELTLWGRIRVRSWQTAVPGVGVDGIELVDTSATGLPWADQALAELRRAPVSKKGRISIQRWLHRREAWPLHRAALGERGLLSERTALLGGTRRAPDPSVREALIADLRAIGAGHRPVDAHGMFLSDLVRAVQLHKTLRIPVRRRRSDLRRGAGSAESVPAELHHASKAIALMVPSTDGLLSRPRV